MKNHLRPLIIAAGITFAGCNSLGETPKATENQDKYPESTIPLDLVKATKDATATSLTTPEAQNDTQKFQPIEVANGDFTMLVNYIEKEGFPVREGDISCDHQITFYDKNGNRHAMMTIKRDTNNKPSIQGTVNQISVWAYHGGIKDQEHFFGYIITENEVRPVTDEPWTERDDVNSAYNEVLKKVKK